MATTIKTLVSILTLGALLAPLAGPRGQAHAQGQPASRYFPQTGQTLSGRFLEYWEQHGGLMQQGYPISGELQEMSEVDGRIYTTQYFERAVFELHPENQRPNDVLLSLLGVLAYQRKYPDGAPGQNPNRDPGSVLFPETGKRVGGSFLSYFNSHGGVRQQGLPISDEFQERSDVDGRVRTVQYFERAVFEWNPQNRPPYNVLLSLLGTFSWQERLAPLPDPVIPPVADPKKVQTSPVGSNRYLLWYEGSFYGPRRLPFEYDIRALDLRSNRVITVTDAPGNQLGAAIEGSLVAWKNDTSVCQDQGCPQPGIAAKDLATGASYGIAQSGPGYAWYPDLPAVTGRTVAWIETASNRAHILAKNVDTGATVLVRDAPSGTPSLQSLQAAGGMLAWREVVYGPTGGERPVVSFWTYNLASGRATQVLSYRVPPTQALPEFLLSGGRLAVTDTLGGFYVLDLATGRRTDFPNLGAASGVTAFQGDRLLVTVDVPGRNAPANSVYLFDVAHPERQPVLLLPNPSGGQPPYPEYTATLAGDRLVWRNLNDPKPGLRVQKLVP